MKPIDKLHEMAKVAGTLAGLTEAQIPGLAELFLIVWEDGAKTQAREDGDRCDREAKRWVEFMTSHGLTLDGPDGKELQGSINTAAILAGLCRTPVSPHVDPDEDDAPPLPSKPTKPKRRARGSRRGGRRG